MSDKTISNDEKNFILLENKRKQEIDDENNISVVKKLEISELKLDQSAFNNVGESNNPALIKFVTKRTAKFDITKIESDFDYGFENSLRSLCVKDRKTEIYEFASEHLDIFLDVETVIDKFNEIEMIKDYVFDFQQKKMFEILSKLQNVKNFFSAIEEIKEDFFKEYNEKRNKDIIEDVRVLLNRGSNKDKKLLLNFRKFFKIV